MVRVLKVIWYLYQLPNNKKRFKGCTRGMDNLDMKRLLATMALLIIVVPVAIEPNIDYSGTISFTILLYLGIITVIYWFYRLIVWSNYSVLHLYLTSCEIHLYMKGRCSTMSYVLME